MSNAHRNTRPILSNSQTKCLGRVRWGHWLSTGFLGTVVPILHGACCKADDDVRFVPRSDSLAESDLKDLRFALSKVQDSKGPIDPLADYVKNPEASPKPKSSVDRTGRIEWKDDDDAWETPKLVGEQGKQYRSPRIELESVKDLTPSRMTDRMIDRGNRNLLSRGVENVRDDFRPATLRDDVDALTRPYVDKGVTYASATVPWNASNQERLARYQEIPYGSVGTPALPNMAAPGLPFPGNTPTFNQPVLPPNYFPGQPANIPYQPTPGPSNLSTTPPQGVPGVTSGITNPIPIANNPPSYPVVPGNMVPSGGLVAPAPQPLYGSMTSGGNAPYGYVQPIANPPRYETNTGIVNHQPFVSGPPRETDARFMVSPTLFRPAVDECASIGGQPRPYATSPGGTPFSYAPPTYFPNTYNGYNSGYRPLFGFGQDLRQAQLGRGWYGQPTAYMPNQPVRNFFRYLFP